MMISQENYDQFNISAIPLASCARLIVSVKCRCNSTLIFITEHDKIVMFAPIFGSKKGGKNEAYFTFAK